MNDVGNWAARGTLLFEPTLDMSWLLNAHGSRRDELSRLGQSIGTAGSFCIDGGICTAPFQPPQLLGEASGGLLGGSQGLNSVPATGYQPPEIRARWEELAPCLTATNAVDRCALQPTPVRVQANQAKIQTANELARDLDSEPWAGDFNLAGPTTNDTWGAYLKVSIALPRGIEFATVSAYDTYDRLIDIDLDFSPETLFQIETKDDGWQFYQDLSFAGGLGGEGRLSWEAGGWLLREELDVVVTNDFGDTLAQVGVQSRDYTQRLWSAAAYGSFSFDFWDDFSLDGGFRYNWEQKDLHMLIEAAGSVSPGDCQRPEAGGLIQCELDETWHAPTGTIRLTYRFRDDTHAFWKYTRGWKAGTFNATASQFTGPSVAQPETINSFETGVRGSWFEGRLGLDTSFFYYDYSDYQIFTARQFLGGSPEFVILNANDAEVYGAEADVLARPWEGAFLNVRFSWLESQFLDFLTVDQFLADEGGGDLVTFKENQNSGNPLLNSPRFKVSMTAEQTFPLGRYGALTLRYDGVWTDTTYFDPTAGQGLGTQEGEKFLPDDTIAQKPYWLHNLRLSWRAPSNRIEIAGWVRNLEDTPYKTFAFDGSTFQSTTIYFVGDPRTYGISMAVNF